MEALRYEVVRAQVDALRLRRRADELAYDDYREIRLRTPNRLEHLYPAEAGKVDVKNDDRVSAGLGHRECVDSVASTLHAKPHPRQERGVPLVVFRVVLGDKCGFSFHIAHYSKSPTAMKSPLPQLRKSARVEGVPDLDFDFVQFLHQQRVVLAPDPRLAARKRGH